MLPRVNNAKGERYRARNTWLCYLYYSCPLYLFLFFSNRGTWMRKGRAGDCTLVSLSLLFCFSPLYLWSFRCFFFFLVFMRRRFFPISALLMRGFINLFFFSCCSAIFLFWLFFWRRCLHDSLHHHRPLLIAPVINFWLLFLFHATLDELSAIFPLISCITF